MIPFIVTLDGQGCGSGSRHARDYERTGCGVNQRLYEITYGQCETGEGWGLEEVPGSSATGAAVDWIYPWVGEED